MKPNSNPCHIVQRFEDNPPGMMSSRARFEVISYFAPQFTKLRSRCINRGELSFVLSMTRSRRYQISKERFETVLRWQASGGKSNAYFAKTLDDRYIIKSLSRVEKAAFLDKFGPAYFNYLDAQHHAKQDVSMAKCLGLFQVSMKSYSKHNKSDNGAETDLGRDWVLDLIVIENLFYGRNCTSIYDLKGSQRGRYNREAEKTVGEKKGVYLDSNLRKHNTCNPPLLVDAVTLKQLGK